ncbi:MAG: response regulator [Candidatus Adiutrix sp.]
MAKVLISLDDAHVLGWVTEALGQTRHEAIFLDAFTADESAATLAEHIMSHKADVMVLNYINEDAASVKLMQCVNDYTGRPEFIFIETDDEAATREQVLMAINEGARAFLPKTVKPAAMLNYLERAISGPLRLRINTQATYDPSSDLDNLTKTLGTMRRKVSLLQQLTSFLLATPLSEQMRKLLIVSDSPYQLERLKVFFEDYNFTVLTAATAADALKKAQGEKPRIVISDLELEDKSGIELCQAIKFTHKIEPCYFVICTANQDSFEKVMLPATGVNDCLVKPSSSNDFAEFISRVAIGLIF